MPALVIYLSTSVNDTPPSAYGSGLAAWFLEKKAGRSKDVIYESETSGHHQSRLAQKTSRNGGLPILIENEGEQIGQFNATRGGTASYESCYGLIGRFFDANALSLARLVRLPIWKKRANVGDARCCNLVAMSELLDLPKSGVLDAFVLPKLGLFRTSLSRLRFCIRCAGLGWHFTIFQVLTLERCPLHDLELIDACPECKTVIPYSIFGWARAGPFCCPNCRSCFGPSNVDTTAKRPKLLPADIRRRLHTVYVGDRTAFMRLTDLDRWSIDGWRPVVAGPASELHGEGIMRVFATACMKAELRAEHAKGHLTSLTMKPLCGDARGVVCRAFTLPSRFGPSTEEQPFGLAFNRCYRTIKRFIRKKFLKGNRANTVSLIRAVNYCAYGEVIQTNASAQIQAFVRWRMQWEGVRTPAHLLRRPVHGWLGIETWLAFNMPFTPVTLSKPAEGQLLLHVFCEACLDTFYGYLDYAQRRGHQHMPWARLVTPAPMWLAFGVGNQDDPIRLYTSRTIWTTPP